MGGGVVVRWRCVVIGSVSWGVEDAVVWGWGVVASCCCCCCSSSPDSIVGTGSWSGTSLGPEFDCLLFGLLSWNSFFFAFTASAARPMTGSHPRSDIVLWSSSRMRVRRPGMDDAAPVNVMRDMQRERTSRGRWRSVW